MAGAEIEGVGHGTASPKDSRNGLSGCGFLLETGPERDNMLTDHIVPELAVE